MMVDIIGLDRARRRARKRRECFEVIVSAFGGVMLVLFAAALTLIVTSGSEATEKLIVMLIAGAAGTVLSAAALLLGFRREYGVFPGLSFLMMSHELKTAPFTSDIDSRTEAFLSSERSAAGRAIIRTLACRNKLCLGELDKAYGYISYDKGLFSKNSSYEMKYLVCLMGYYVLSGSTDHFDESYSRFTTLYENRKRKTYDISLLWLRARLFASYHNREWTKCSEISCGLDDLLEHTDPAGKAAVAERSLIRLLAAASDLELGHYDRAIDNCAMAKNAAGSAFLSEKAAEITRDARAAIAADEKAAQRKDDRL